jgi:SAM-dependent methyltransferase
MPGHSYLEPVTGDNFDEEGYLGANPDVRAAVEAGKLASGRQHFDGVGHGEGRSVRLRANIKQAKLAKSRRILAELIDPVQVQAVRPDGLIDCLPADVAAAAGVIDTDAVSSNPYDDVILGYVEDHPDRWILDAGSGLRSTYYENTVNFEIVPYDTTDVLGVGEFLPFRDGAFDMVVSVAVLEHVRDPFRCAAELYRVLRPGGELFVAVPFLQPFHGYPDHYYNMTSSGLRNLFREPLAEVEQYVPHYLKPIWVASWFFSLWAAGLPEKAREELKRVTVADFLGATVADYEKSWHRDLDPATANLIASGTILRARKPEVRS